MQKISVQRIILQISLWIIGSGTICQATEPGYFKDVFVDGGVSLTTMVEFLAAEGLGLSLEILGTSDPGFQDNIIISSANDSNGHLLYPDGQPRFRMIYVNGGSSTNHGNSLGETGRDRLRTFYYNGGSYMGSCAGAYLACLHSQASGENPAYLHIWPGRAQPSGLTDAYTDHDIPPDSPLLSYNDFGSDSLISGIRHNGGCWAREDIDFPRETVALLRYHTPELPGMDEKLSTWAYKATPEQGRIVVTGSHPEFEPSGEVFDLTQAMLLYALDGCGEPEVKAHLANGFPRSMNLYFEDGQPEFTRIGDRQYHHFSIMVPEMARRLMVDLDAEDSFEFNLYADPDSFAFEGTASYTSPESGSEHSLEIAIDEPGLWYIGVECATSVSSAGTMYWGQTQVLNGIAYTITARWDTLNIVSQQAFTGLPPAFELLQNTPNPFNATTVISYRIAEAALVSLTIFDLQGHRVQALADGFQLAGEYQLAWNAQDESGVSVPTGIYLAHLAGAGYSQTIKLLCLK